MGDFRKFAQKDFSREKMRAFAHPHSKKQILPFCQGSFIADNALIVAMHPFHFFVLFLGLQAECCNRASF